ncbi:condensation domain-containing protein [Streptomyces demainii]|uniref:Non-ribosomal peptide synthetase component F n=1 Tax=Streptomyces demainii TaxID=588122 RepID=A0ABT9KX13_9ACTN|nr:condensation domain-containing protein [Streptomyces demainii]MDP9612960.1 non-ribosomal peptide synthetase component F [Streptomyces demainii]
MHDVPLPEGMSAAVLRTAARLRVPVKSVLLTAHVAVMGFVAGTDDVLVGYEHSGRPEVVGGERLAGLFLNTVPFRLRLEDVSWAELVRSVHAAEAGCCPPPVPDGPRSSGGSVCAERSSRVSSTSPTSTC